tara:strand:- start:8421 stop:9323 length:903 start_codon:yes stop_codon:yes gene_type:complete
MSDTQNTQATEVEQPQVEAPQETAVEPKPEEDIFNDIFGDNSNEFAFQTGEPTETSVDEPSEVTQSVDPKEDNNQYQYWQSQADKRAAEVDLLKSQVSDLMAQKTQTASPAPAEKETAKLEKPVKPQKPADFDHSEAIADPDSRSAKYLVKQTEYMESMTDYTTSLEEQRIQSMRTLEEQTKKQAQEAQLVSDLQRNYGYSLEDANDFMVKMTAPESMSLDNLVKLHRINTQPQEQSSQTITQVSDAALQKQANMMQQKSKLSIPKPIGVKAGVNMQSSKKSEDKMMDSMIQNFNKKNPF